MSNRNTLEQTVCYKLIWQDIIILTEYSKVDDITWIEIMWQYYWKY